MAFVRVSGSGATLDAAHLPFPRTSGATFTSGEVVAWNRASNVIQDATSSTDSQSANCYIGVICGATGVTGQLATEVDVSPFEKNQLWLADCNANTAASQVGARCRLTDSLTLDNQADRTTSSDIFEIIKLVGAASDKKAIVRIIGGVGQVNA